VIWLLLPAAFVLGLVVGQLWLTPVAVVDWILFIRFGDHGTGPRLEPGIAHLLMVVSTAFVFAGSAAGVAVREVIRRKTSPEKA
jgi:hypothetical protein